MSIRSRRERRDSLLQTSSAASGGASAFAPIEAAERHFGFAPVAFVDDVVNACNDYAYDGVDYVERKLRDSLNKQLPKHAHANDITAGADGVLENFQRALDVNLDRFELYSLQNLFVVPAASAAWAATSSRARDRSDDDNNDDDDDDDQGTSVRPSDVELSSVDAEAELDAELEHLLLLAEQLLQANDLLRRAIAQSRADADAIRPLVDACRPLRDANVPPGAALRSLAEQLGGLRGHYTETKALFDASDAHN